MTKKSDPTDMSHPDYDAARDPTHPFYEGDDSDHAQNNTSSAEQTKKVGPGYPPDEYKYKKGCPSPNPKGRPRKDRTLSSDFKEIMQAALNEKVTVTKDKKETTLTKGALIIQQLVNQAAKGDRHARRDLFLYAPQLGVDLYAKDVIAEALGLDQQAIVDAAFSRRQQQTSPTEPAPDDHVKAPPDLLDDDVAKTEPPAPPAAPRAPAAPVPPFNGQPLDQNGTPMPHNRASILAERERTLAQLKKNQEGS